MYVVIADPPSPDNVCVAKGGECYEVFVTPLRILVCASFVGMHARQDFDPKGALVACRFYPIFEITMNQPLEEIIASITYKRPKRMSMKIPDMESEIRSGLFADNNQGGILPPFPNRDEIFDYYLIEGVGGTRFRAVDRSKTTTRSLTGETAKLKFRPILDPDDRRFGPPLYSWTEQTVKKIPRQGEFDNLHVAARMVDAVGPVVMAPICQHDCMHTHWRWGSMFDNKESKGWDADFPTR